MKLKPEPEPQPHKVDLMKAQSKVQVNCNTTLFEHLA